ncbi:MAG: UpxY family transcription antiterminator [Bacteroidetes bacterium]|nr:UpxY family transcription antiterminator [Bacteroidota bacterium]
MRDKDSIPTWYVVKTNSRAEKKVFERIESIGMEAYLPLVITIKQWSDRKKKIDVPLIASTIFVKCKEEDLNLLYNITGFHSLLYYLSKPAKVRNIEIQNLRILLSEDFEFNQENFESIQGGDKVEVIRGPFQGLIATSLEVDRKHRLIVEIECLEQRFVVNVPKSNVRKI